MTTATAPEGTLGKYMRADQLKEIADRDGVYKRRIAELEAAAPPDEALDLITELVGYLQPWTSIEQGGEVELQARAKAFLARYRETTP